MSVSGIPINPSVLSSGTKNLHLLSQVKRKIHRLKPGLGCGGRYFSKPRTKPLIHNCCKFIHHQIKSSILFNDQSRKNVNNETNREAPWSSGDCPGLTIGAMVLGRGFQNITKNIYNFTKIIFLLWSHIKVLLQ